MSAGTPHGERIERLTLSGLRDLGLMREVVRELVLGCAQPDVIDAMLVADEMGTLACEYGQLPASVGAIRDYDTASLRIVVTAARLGLPASPSRLVTSCRVFDTCAEDWGVREQDGADQLMWARVSLAGAPRPDGVLSFRSPQRTERRARPR